jgi:hypothetical protein
MDFSISGAVNAVKGGYKAAADAVTDTASAAVDTVTAGARVVRDQATALVPDSLGAAGDALLAIAPYTPMSVAFLGAGGLAKAAQFTYDHFMTGATKADQAFLAANAKQLGPDAMVDFKKLADLGKLSAMDKDGKTLRGSFEAMIQAGQDKALVAAIGHQLADPTAIHQVRDNTCSAAALQEAIAASNPARYAELAKDLVNPPHQATLPNGKALQVSPANAAWIEAQNFSPADRINAYMQAALMDYANGSGAYDIATDTTTNSVHIPFMDDPLKFVTEGLNITQAQNLGDVLGNVPIVDPTQVEGRNPGERSAALRNLLAQAKKDGAPGFLIPVHGHSGKLHMVLIMGIDSKTGKVTVFDPGTGGTTSIPADRFDKWVAWDAKKWDDIGATGGPSTTNGGVRGGRP